LRDGTPPAALQGLPAGDLIKRVTRRADYDRWSKDFLG
jgi:carboxyvinyl-carboxyphosphonate phosphorylmutase